MNDMTTQEIAAAVDALVAEIGRLLDADAPDHEIDAVSARLGPMFAEWQRRVGGGDVQD